MSAPERGSLLVRETYDTKFLSVGSAVMTWIIVVIELNHLIEDRCLFFILYSYSYSCSDHSKCCPTEDRLPRVCVLLGVPTGGNLILTLKQVEVFVYRMSYAFWDCIIVGFGSIINSSGVFS